MGAVRTVLQPAVAVRGERYRGRGGDVEAVGEVADETVEIGGGLLGDRHGGAEGGPGADDDRGDQRGQQEREHGGPADRPAGDAPAAVRAEAGAEMAGGAAREEHHGNRGGQYRRGQRRTADAEYGQGAGTRRQDACFRTCHEPVHPLLS